MKKKFYKFWTYVPPWIILGSILILFPIFAFITFENINRQKNNSKVLLLEKGAALIRAFEAGTRAQMMHRYWNNKRLQQLLVETAQQSDISYIMVVNTRGRIIADSNPDKIGKKIKSNKLKFNRIVKTNQLHWQEKKLADKTDIFEVFKKFSPTHIKRPKHHKKGSKHLKMMAKLNKKHMINKKPQIIFIGLNMKSVESAISIDTNHFIFMGVVLLLIGSAGIILLFMAQSFHSTKKSLTRIKAFSDNLVDNMPIGLIAINEKNKIIYCNHQASIILLQESRNVIGKKAHVILPKNILEIIKNLKKDSQILGNEIECTIEKNKIIPIEVSASTFSDENKNYLGYIILLKDLSEIQSLRRQIAQNKHLASIGRLAAGVAHEIRNPLSSIKGFATYFKQRYQDVSEDQQNANIMIEEVDRLNKVVGQLLDFAKPIKLSMGKLDLKTLIENSLNLIKDQANKKNIIIETDISPEFSNVLADKDKLNQVMLNLYLNAIEAMENGGMLSIEVNKNIKSNYVAIIVADTGVGINAKDISNIFDPYYTTKPSGTGLGLAIVHNIILAHRAKIEIKQRKNRGIKVIILLPYEER